MSQNERADADIPDDTTKRVKELIKKKLKERGYPVPASPPPAPNATNDPFAMQLLDSGGKLIYEKFSHCLIRHACGTKITKMGSCGIRPSEVEALRFVAENTTIPVPRVYEVGDGYFTMDFIPGDTLSKAWDTISEDDRALVRRQLRDYINQLRAIKSPDGIICTFGNRPAVDSRLFLHESGPFANESDYNDFLVSGLQKYGPIRDILRGQLREREGHEIVFSHGDLHAINILVRPGEGIVAIVDWELAGYYPEYFDFVKPYRPANWGCGYYHEFHDISPKRYDGEFVVDQLLSKYTRH